MRFWGYHKYMQAKMRSLTIILLIGLSSLACNLSAPTPQAWVQTPSAAALASTQTASALSSQLTNIPTISATETPLPTTAALPTATKVAEDGPWLVFLAKDRVTLNALDRDTGSITKLDLPALVVLADLKSGLSPSGSGLLLRAGSIDALDELALYLIDSPHEPIDKISPLLSVYLQREYLNQNTGYAAQALLAVQQKDGISWSPDGKLFAFTAALDGDSSNIYLFDTVKNRLDRMTVRFRQNLTPAWSPDMQWLIFQEALSLSDSITWNTSQVSGVSMPDYAITKILYLPIDDGLGEVFAGWLNESILLSYSRVEGGFSHLRQVDVNRAEALTIFPGQFRELAFDKSNQTIAINVDAAAAEANKQLSGIYISTTGGSQFNLAAVGEYQNLQYSLESGLFLASNPRGVFGINAGGIVISLLQEEKAAFSPNNSWLLGWSKSGANLFTTQGKLLQELIDEPVVDAVWLQNAKGFYLVAESGLYHYAFPILKPKWITDDIALANEIFTAWLK